MISLCSGDHFSNASSWRLERFAEHLESWIEREDPTTDLRRLAAAV
jgi:hypothetical protein